MCTIRQKYLILLFKQETCITNSVIPMMSTIQFSHLCHCVRRLLVTTFFLSQSIVMSVSGTPHPVWDVYQLGLKKRPNYIRFVQNNILYIMFVRTLSLFKHSLYTSVQLAPWIKARMMEKGSAMVGYQPLGGKVNFFRCILSNSATQQEDIDFLLDQIVQLGQYLWCFQFQIHVSFCPQNWNVSSDLP